MAIVRSPPCKPRLRVTRHAEDPFLIGRELISQGCDWPNENLVSIPVKQPKKIQVLLSFPSSIASRGISRSNRVCEEVLWSFARHTPPHRSFYQENSRRSKENQKVSFLKYLTPPDFCLFDVRRRVEKNVSHWLKNGGVLRGSGRGGLSAWFRSLKQRPGPD